MPTASQLINKYCEDQKINPSNFYNTEIWPKTKRPIHAKDSYELTLNIIEEIQPKNYNIRKIAEQLEEAEKNPTKKKYPEALLLLAKNKRREATEALAQNYHNENKIYSIRNDQNEELWVYKDGIYTPNGKSYVKEYVREIVGEAYTTTLANEVIAKLVADTQISNEEFFKIRNKYEICVKNGILNIETGELTQHTPEKIHFNQIPVDYIPGVDCPEIKQFLTEVLPEKKTHDIVAEIAGYCLLKDYPIHKAVILLGAGRNGKSVLMKLIQTLLGIDSCVEIPLQDLERDQYALGELHGKNANLCGDLSPKALEGTGVFKKITGGDLLSAQRKYLGRITFTNYSKQIFSCNELPMPKDVSEAFFNRWVYLDFPFTFLPENELKTREGVGETVFLRDDYKIEKITTNEELTGFLNYSLEGLQRLLKNGQFTDSKTTQEIKKMWFRRSDSFLAFCQDHVTEDYSSECLKNELRRVYTEYCRKHRLRPSSDKVINTVLTETYGAGESKSGGDRYWVGVKVEGVKEPVRDKLSFGEEFI